MKRILAAAVLCFAAAIPAPSSARTSADRALQLLNSQCARQGLPALAANPRLASGCAAHNRYQALNISRGSAPFVAGEISGRRGYTPDGARATPGSVSQQSLAFIAPWDGAWTSP